MCPLNEENLWESVEQLTTMWERPNQQRNHILIVLCFWCKTTIVGIINRIRVMENCRDTISWFSEESFKNAHSRIFILQRWIHCGNFINVTSIDWGGMFSIVVCDHTCFLCFVIIFSLLPARLSAVISNNVDVHFFILAVVAAPGTLSSWIVQQLDNVSLVSSVSVLRLWYNLWCEQQRLDYFH